MSRRSILQIFSNAQEKFLLFMQYFLAWLDPLGISTVFLHEKDQDSMFSAMSSESDRKVRPVIVPDQALPSERSDFTAQDYFVHKAPIGRNKILGDFRSIH